MSATSSVSTMATTIAVPGGETVSAAVHVPDTSAGAKASGVAVALAPGAGSSMDNPFLVTVADALVAAGHVVMRFNFVYRERGSARPDPTKKLVETYRAAADALRERAAAIAGERGLRRLFLGGRSMGGRMATMLAAEGYACEGLILLGYPLHPAKQPEKLRDAHLPQVAAPMLFVQGTRDALCDLDLLAPVLARIGPRATLLTIQGADHGFEVRKSDGRTYEDVVRQIIGGVTGFLAERSA